MPFFFRNGFHVSVKGCTTQNYFFFWKFFLFRCISGPKSSMYEKITLCDKRSNIQQHTEDKRFHNHLCFGSLSSKWQQNITLGKKTNTDQLAGTLGQNICQTFNFNNIVFLYTKFTCNTCYTCSKRNYLFIIN